MYKKRILSFVLCVLMIVSSSVCVMADDSGASGSQIKNIIYMIPDGGAMEPFNLAAEVKKAGGFDPSVYPYATPVEQGDMYLRQYLVGAETTYSANNAVTDSAAAGTALSSGYKTNNGCIGVDPQQRPHANLLEASQSVGKNVGLVSTYEWMHATPASFSAHETYRDNYTPMSEQIVNQDIDVVLGAGFDAARWGNLSEAEKRGYDIIDTRAELEAVQPGDRIWGNLVGYNFMWDIERPESVPNLAEMTTAAIRALDGDSENGFFLMVEGSKVDGGGHDNKAREMVSEFLAFDKACEVAIEYAKTRNDTLVVVLPDHDTGGLVVNDLETTVEKIRKGIQPTNDVDVTWTTGSNHSARNGGIFMYVPEGVPYPEGLNNTSDDPFNENIVDNTVIAPYLADFIGVDLDELTEELFVDVTEDGWYDDETEVFTFNDYDFSIKRNESRAYYAGNEISLDGQVSLYINNVFYVPQLLLDKIEELEGEFNSSDAFKPIQAADTTTANDFATEAEGENTALSDITCGTKLYYGPHSLGRTSSNGLNLRMNIPTGAPEDYTVNAYLVEDGEETLLGTYEAVMAAGDTYNDYFLPFNKNISEDVTIALEFGKDIEADVKVDLSTITFLNASYRANAFSENFTNSHQFTGPAVELGAVFQNNTVYSAFGTGTVGDYMIAPNVYFGDREAKAVLLGVDPPSAAAKGTLKDTAKVEVRLDGPSGEIIGELDYDDLDGTPDGWGYLTLVLDEPITGSHNICFVFKDFNSNFGSYRFIIPKDGTSLIRANQYDSLYGDVGNAGSGPLSHFGQTDGEKLYYNLLDFGDEDMDIMDITFGAWGYNEEQKKEEGKMAGENSRMDIYIDSIASKNLIGTLSYDDLSAHVSEIYTYTIPLEPGRVTGLHNIILVSYWQGEIQSFKFISAKDGTQRILPWDNDDVSPAIDSMTTDEGYRVADWFGNISSSGAGEELNFKLVNFGNNVMDTVLIRFRPSLDAQDEAVNGGGKLEVYADNKLVATVPFKTLDRSADKFTTFSVPLTEPLTGFHDIKIVSYWQGGLSWFQFTGQDTTAYLETSAGSVDKTTGAVSLTVTGETDAASVMVVFAAYDTEGKLINYAESAAKTAGEVATGAVCSANFEASIPAGATVKAYVWNSVETLMPLALPVTIAD